MSKYKFTPWEIITITRLLNDVKASTTSELYRVGKLADQMELTKEEGKNINLQAVGGGLVWSNTEAEFERELSKRQFERIKELINASLPTFTVGERKVLFPLLQKFGIEIDEADEAKTESPDAGSEN